MANGKVITGYSMPFVALYNANDGAPMYTNGMPLARGVNVSIEPESGDGNNFYADNVVAESVGGTFTGATATFTIDGLKKEARKLIMGLPEEEIFIVDGKEVALTVYDDRQVIPNLGVGFVVRYMENGVTTFAPVVLTKVAFNVDGLSAATQEENIEFQTTELSATVMRDDSANHAWRKIADDQTDEATAVAVVKALLGVTATEDEGA